MGEQKPAKQDILNRLKTVRGHIGGIEKMIEDGGECTDVLVQLAAIKSSISKVTQIIVENHLEHCLLDITGDNEDARKRVSKTIAKILKLMQ